MTKILLIVSNIFLFFLFLTPESLSQTNQNKVFDSITIKFNLVVNKSTDELNRYWKGGKGLECGVEMPFYFGDIEAGIRYLPYKESEPYYHDFSTLFYYLSWGKDINLPLKFKFFNGIKFGGYQMSFHDDSLSVYQRDETELAAGFFSRLSVEVIKEFQLSIGAEYTRVFTHKRIELFLISSGVAYSFKTPTWLKELLK